MRVQLLLLSLLMLVDWTEGKCKTGSLTAVEQAILDKHNALRKLHKDTPDLCYAETGTDVTFSSETWATSMAAAKKMTHSKSSDYGGASNVYGENLAYYTTTATRESQTYYYEWSTQAWYDEIEFWDFATSATKDSSKATGHFTQLAWKNSKQVHCAYKEYTEDSDGKNWKSMFVVCQYYPAGNYETQYAANVQPRDGDDTGNKTGNDTDSGSVTVRDSFSVVLVLLSLLSTVRAFF